MRKVIVIVSLVLFVTGCWEYKNTPSNHQILRICNHSDMDIYFSQGNCEGGIFDNYDICLLYTSCFLATDLERIGEPHQEATEDIAIELLEPEEVKELLMENQIMQAMHVAALWKYFYEKTKADEDGAGKSGISEKFCDR